MVWWRQRRRRTRRRGREWCAGHQSGWGDPERLGRTAAPTLGCVSESDRDGPRRVRPGVLSSRRDRPAAGSPVNLPDDTDVADEPAADEGPATQEMPAMVNTPPPPPPVVDTPDTQESTREMPVVTEDEPDTDTTDDVSAPEETLVPSEPAVVDVVTESALGRAPAVVAPGVRGASQRAVLLRGPRRRPRVRRVTRVLRHIDPWSAFKVGALFSLVLYVICLTSGVMLWRVAESTGTLGNVERWFTQFGWETFEFDGGAVFDAAWVIGLFVAVGLTGFFVLVATVFNLVSDIVGGVRVSVLEEEVTERSADPVQRFRRRRPTRPSPPPQA